jgi:hypothetical protein
MATRQELEENRTIDRQVPTYTHTPERCKRANSSEIRTAGCNHTKHGCNANSEVECPSSPKDIAAETPEYGTDQEPDVLRQSKQRRTIRIELVAYGREDEGCRYRPKIVHRPPKTNNNEELILVLAHANLLDRLVENSGLGCVNRVE